jgi:prefoldin subunit 5
MLSSVEEELSDVKKLLSEKMCREQELEEMSEKQRRSLEELSQRHESLQSELNAVHTAREEG